MFEKKEIVIDIVKMDANLTIANLEEDVGTPICSYILGHFSGGCHFGFDYTEIRFGLSPKCPQGHYVSAEKKHMRNSQVPDIIHLLPYKLSLKKHYDLGEFGIWSSKSVPVGNGDNHVTLSRLLAINQSFIRYVDINFLKGCFDQNGEICLDDEGYPLCKLHLHNDNAFDMITTVLNSMVPKIPYEEMRENSFIKWHGINAVDILGVLYKNLSCVCNEYLYDKYINMLTYHVDRVPLFKYMLTIEGAHKPEKSRESDAGYDLWLEKKIKTENGVSYFDTGVAISPEYGYYCELVGRSSIAKSGYMLANNIGIIDANYNGSIIVALVKINSKKEEKENEEEDELKLPIKLVQILPRKHMPIQMQQVYSLNRTSRDDDGGLGSKNIK